MNRRNSHDGGGRNQLWNQTETAKELKISNKVDSEAGKIDKSEANTQNNQI